MRKQFISTPSAPRRGYSLSFLVPSLLGLCCCCICAAPALAQMNNFFGSNPGGGASQINSNQQGNGSKEDDGAAGPGIPLMNGALPPPAPSGGDFTQDEKRMQRKYRGNLHNAQDLIHRGEAMMNAAGNNKDSKDYKRGKVLKDIGEKSLADLKANNPYDVDKEKPIFAERKNKSAAEKQVNP
jgi:hypothetical protein